MSTAPLIPLPYAKRRKGLSASSYGFDLILKVLDFLGDGATRVELRQFLRREYPELSEATLAVQESALRRDFQVIEYESDRVVVTTRGRQVLEQRAGTSLVPQLLTDFVGIDHLMVKLRDAGPQKRKLLMQLLKKVHPGWTTSFAPAGQITWLRVLGAIEWDGDLLRLTPGGQELAKLVTWVPEFGPEKPVVAPTEPLSVEDDSSEEETEDEGAGVALQPPTFAEVWKKLEEHSSLRFDKQQVAVLHAGLWSHPRRHFAVFAGLSGSGKTSLAHAYGRALAELTSGALEVIPVSPGWTDATPLLGYVKPLSHEPDYERPSFLKLLLRCELHPQGVHVAILDEMNLSHPEQYLAPLLSAMELSEPVVIHNHSEHFDGVPPQLKRYPQNLVLIGTVNMDETTHGLSDKVLDRATTLEFWDIDVDGHPGLAGAQLPDSQLSAVKTVLTSLVEILEPHRLHFGWRVVDDVVAFLERAHSDEALPAQEALDWIVYGKILPKFRGHDTPALREAFKKCSEFFKEHQLKRCAGKIDDLLKDLEHTGSARFWR